MSLSEQLKDLKKQRRESIKDLHLTYVHTKRELTRTISPDRHIRRHLGVALGLAAVTGMLLAPAPGRARKEKPRPKTKKSKSRDSMLSKMLRPILFKFVPEARQFMPDLDDSARAADEHHEHEEYFDDPNRIGPRVSPEMREEDHEPAQRSSLAPMITELALLLAKRLDLQKIMHLVTHYMAAKKEERSGNGHSSAGGPRVSVANTGTIRTPPPEE